MTPHESHCREVAEKLWSLAKPTNKGDYVSELKEFLAKEFPDVNKWVSVDDRLPENKTACLIFRDYPRRELSEYSIYEDGKWRATVGSCWSSVTHWRPLPAPPTKE
jgi:hypothetical protein